MSTLVQKLAPDFKATAVVNGQFKEIQLNSYRGDKYVVLYFYPLNEAANGDRASPDSARSW